MRKHLLCLVVRKSSTFLPQNRFDVSEHVILLSGLIVVSNYASCSQTTAEHINFHASAQKKVWKPVFFLCDLRLFTPFQEKESQQHHSV